MKPLRKIVSDNPADQSVESRLFSMTLLITVFIFYFWSVLAIVFGYDWPITTVYFAGSGIYTGIYIWYRRGGSLRFISLLYYLLVFTIIGVAWLPSGGLKGAITFFVVLVYLSGLLVLDPKDFRLFILISIGMVLFFTAYEFANPEAAAPYLDQIALLRDLAIVNVTTLGVLSIAMYTFKKAYAKDRVRLKRANTNLEMQKSKVEFANKAKTTFLANVSHEMRTPLNGIVGIAELLKQTNLTHEQTHLVNDLVYSSDILRGLISNVLDISMIEEGKMVLLNTEFDYHKVIDQVAKFFQPIFAERSGLDLIIETDYAIPLALLGDPGRLQQVLINLINNAVKFTDSGYVKVSSKLLTKENSQVIVRVTVEDTGSGIDASHQEYIFDEFHREDRVAGIEGTGLGLSICKRIINGMKGNIRLDKSDEFGSTFSFIIPLDISIGQNIELQNIPKLTYDVDLSEIKVLIAEDQAINQMVLTKMLRNLNVSHIDLAEDGQLAVEMALNTNYDFILMDIRMPVKDGITAAKEILELEVDYPPIIISITANALKADQDACFDVGIKDFISKPFSMEVLKSTLAKYMD